MNRLRSWVRRWLGVSDAPPPVAPPAPIPWQEILNRLGVGPTEEPRKPYKLPDPLPGVVPKVLPTKETGLVLAMDKGCEEVERVLATDGSNGAIPPAAWGFGDAGSIGPGVTFLGFPYLAELAQITEYRTPAESLSNEMTRRWLTHTNKGKSDKEDKIKQLDDRMDELNVRDLFREAALKTEQFGRAHLYVSVKNQDDDKTRQLPLDKIGKGELLGFSCVEPYWLTPYSWNATHPERKDFYKPQSWFVIGRKTHASRLLTFIFREVPDLLKPAYDFSGISITQLMMPYVNRWLRTAKNVNDLINIFSIVTLATDLQALIQKPADFMARLQVFTQARDNRGVMAVNKATEELTVNDVSLASLDKLQAQAQEHMATPGRMPLIKFFGITPTGLNTAGATEGEFQAWYDYVLGLLMLGFSPNYQRVLELVQMDLWGSVDPDIGFEWQNLYEPTAKEKGEMRKADADRDIGYINSSVVSPDEVREKLQQDPESGYNNLKGSAPEPQMVQEHNLNEEGAEAAHGRSEESAENAHARQLEVQTAE